jgi:hypothetical protein
MLDGMIRLRVIMLRNWMGWMRMTMVKDLVGITLRLMGWVGNPHLRIILVRDEGCLVGDGWTE